MKAIIANIVRGGGKTLGYLLAVLFAVATSAALPALADEVVDLNGETISADKTAFSAYKDKIIQNGTINLSNSPSDSTAGKYTIGSGATVTYAAGPGFNGDWDWNIVDGGVLHQTRTSDGRTLLPFHYGDCKFTLDNGTFITDDGSSSTGAVALNFAMFWNNNANANGKDSSVAVVVKNGSTLSVPNGKLRISGGRENESQAKYPAKTAKVDFAVTNSTITVKDQIYIGSNISSSKWVTDAGNSYVHVVFGPGADITCNNIYAYKSLVPEVLFDGATVHKSGSDANFIGQHTGVSGDIYTLGTGGLTIDIPSDQSFTAGSNMSVLKGAGGLTKIGDGSITVNSIVSSSSAKTMTFTGPLVVSNGTYSSSLTYAATKFAVDGADSTLALSGSLTATAPDMAATDGGTLNLRTGSVVSRTVGAMTLGEGATLAITGGELGVDSFSAASLALTATAAKPVKIKFDDAGSIASGTYPLITITGGGEFAAGDKAKFALDENAPEGAALSVSGASLVLTVPATNPATWTGGANDGKFSSVDNWLGKAVPGADDDVVISVSAETTLDCDVALSVNSMTFPVTSARVTIDGTGTITCAATIKNYAEERHVIRVPVEFYASDAYAPIDVTGEVEFSGGVKGSLPANHSTFYGNYTLTQGTWSLSSAITLAANATVTATGTKIETSGTSLLNAEAGSTLAIKQLTLNVSGNIFGTYAGNLTVDRIYQYNHGGVTFNSGFSGVLRVNGIHHHSGNFVRDFAFTPAKTATIIFGSGDCGIEMQRGYFQVNGYVFHSTGNWQFDITNSNYGGEDGAGRTVIGANGLVVDTADYDDPTAPGHTVSVNNTGSKSTNVLTGSGGLGVAGNGTFAFNKQGKFTGGLVASNSVTVAVKSGVYPGKGNVTLRDTATFYLVQSGSGTVPVTGTLTMAGGTTLRVPTFTAGVLPLSVNALAFDGVTAENKVALNIEGGALVEGYNAIIQSATAVSADAWDNFDVTLNATVPAGMTPVYVAQGGTLYIVLKGANDAIWTGGGENTNFSNGDNWMGGQVPANGSCVHIAAAGEATLVCDIPDFSPASITFAAGSAAVTINGTEAIFGVVAITNLSTIISHTINVPVYFAGDIQVKQAAMAETGDLTKAHVTFAGGAHAAQGYAIENGDTAAVYSRCMFGDYYLYPEAGSPWTASYQGSTRRNCLADNSVLHITYAGDLTELYIGTGAAVTNGVVALPEDKRLSYQNKGEYVITDEFTVSGSNKKDGYVSYNAGTGSANVFKIEKATCNKTDGYTFYFGDGNGASHGTYYFGAGGINFGGGKGYFGVGRNVDDDAQTIRPWYGDFTIGTGVGNADGFDMWMFRSITFNTDDENGVGRKITLNARPRFNYTPSFTVAGSGTVLVNSVASNTDQPPVTVTDTATLAFAPGALLTTDTTTVASGATLAVAGSGTVAIGGDLTLADGACLGFNYSTRNAPVLDLTNKNVTLGDNKNIVVKITSENGKRAKSGKNVLTSGGNFAGANVTLAEGAPDWVDGISVDETTGNIVLDVKPKGLVFIIN
ncbi:MAG: hypothetical protein IJG18_07035 [Kiritimatiellae bacterium]|nr:hypothetical protein [Kiritimatiellia bacterium]